MAGLAPALKATRPNLASELKNDVAAARAGGRRWTLRDGLVVTQIAVTMVLLVAAGLLTRSLSAAQQVGIGFQPARPRHRLDRDEHARLRRHALSKQFYDRALERVRAIPGVESAALAERLPFSINYNRNNLFLADRHGPDDKGHRRRRRDGCRPSTSRRSACRSSQGRNFNATDTPAVARRRDRQRGDGAEVLAESERARQALPTPPRTRAASSKWSA